MAAQKLRPYQRQALLDASAAFLGGAEAVLVVCPTGGGKTLLGATACESALRHPDGGGVAWLAHRDELVTQARDRLLAHGIQRVGIISSGMRTINAPMQVVSVQTAAARLDRGLPPSRFVVIDEAHHFRADTYSSVLAKFREQNPLVRFLGLTATPERGDGKPLGKEAGGPFDALVSASSVRELQRTIDEVTGRAVLVPCVVWRPSTKTKKLSQDPVAAYLSRAAGERAFVFCQNIKHAEHVAESFREQGVSAATIHADTPWLMRRARVDAFKSQDTGPLLEAGFLEPAPLVLCNVYTLTEGVDVPEASCVLLARGCGHVGMYLQMTGRGMRSAAGKTRMVLIDLCGVSHKHGLPEADRAWSLDGKPIDLAESEKDVKAVVCLNPACGAEFSTWAVDPTSGKRICPACGEEGPALALPEIQHRELHAAGTAASEEDRAKALRHLAETAVRTEKRAGWIAYEMKRIFGDMPARGVAQQAFDFARGASG